MNSKVLAVVLLGGACAAAAGTGAYLALRENPAAPPSHLVTAPAISASFEHDEAVHETEAVLTPEPEPAGQAPAPPPAPRASRATREEPRASAAPRRRSEAQAPRQAGTLPAPPSPSARPSAPSGPSPAPVGEVMPLPPPPPAATRAETLPELPPAPMPVYRELLVPRDAVIGLQIDTGITSDQARVEDRVNARVTRDVRVDGRIAIPAGSRVEGTVTMVERGGKVKERARLGVRFHTLVLADGTRLPLQTETLMREGDSPAGESTAKIGGAAVGGAIIGAILGGGKGAAIGGATGAAGGTAAVMAGGRNPATLPAGSTVTVRVSTPVTVTVEGSPDDIP
jgi:type IV secretory pathway VirB10-like protein